MKIFKKITSIILFSALILSTVLELTSCKRDNAESQIVIVSEDIYNSSVKPKDGKKLLRQNSKRYASPMQDSIIACTATIIRRSICGRFFLLLLLSVLYEELFS